jgi:transcriptional regulator with PAS, ATPase and Fis domain
MALGLVFSELKNLRTRLDEISKKIDSQIIIEPLDAERNEILRALVKHGKSKPAAARELGISLRTLYRKIKEHGIKT